MKRLYFAHPCFTAEERRFKEAFLKALRGSLENSGLQEEFSIIDPFDYAPNVENDPSLKRNVARAIKEVCVRILRESDVMIAVADGDDTGVAFEAGVADTSLIPIVLITDKTDAGKANAMLLGSAAAVVDQIMKPGRIDFMLDIVLGLSVLERIEETGRGTEGMNRKNERPLLGLSRNVFSTGLVSFFMDVSSEMIYPLVPLFLASVLGANKSLIGLIEGIAESVASLLKVFSGWSSDRLGKRKYLMAVGYGISTLSRPIMGLAGAWQHVLGARIVDRVGKGIRTAPRDAIIAESTETSQLARAFSFHRSMDTMGAVVGPLLALLLLGFFHSDYRKVFWISIVPAVLAVLVIFLFIRERDRPHSGRLFRPRLTLKHFDRKVKFFIGIATLFALGNSSDVFLILRAGQIGIGPAMIPAVYLLFNLVYSLSAIPFGVAADRFGRKRVILIGFVLFALVYSGFARVESVAAVWVLFGVYGLFMGLTEGIQKAFLATIIPSDFKATAFGVYATAVGLATFPASLIGGWLWDRFSPAATFYFGATTAGLSALLFLGLIIAARKSPEMRA